MAGYLNKFTPLADGTAVEITGVENFTAFDFTNNSPFDIDIAWGKNKPASLSIPPTTLWRGARPEGAFLISGNQWGGVIIATPSLPAGGTPPLTAPALQLTVHGYERGAEPREQVINLNTLTSVGNTVLQAATVVNDGNVISTRVVEGSVQGDNFSSLLLNNDGSGQLGGGAGPSIDPTLLIAFNNTGDITSIRTISFDPNLIAGAVNVLAIANGEVGGTQHSWALIYGTDGSLTWQDVTVPFNALVLKEDKSGNLSGGQISWTAAGNLTAIRLIASLNFGGSNQVYWQAIAPDGPQAWNIDLFVADKSYVVYDQTNNKACLQVFVNNGGIATAVVKEIAGTQETGHFHFQGHAGAAETWQFYVRFRLQMTNTPSSITLSGVTSTNVTSENISNITTDGFQLNVVVTAAGLFTIDLTWATVGN